MGKRLKFGHVEKQQMHKSESALENIQIRRSCKIPENVVGYEGGSDTNYNWSPGNGPQKSRKETLEKSE